MAEASEGTERAATCICTRCGQQTASEGAYVLGARGPDGKAEYVCPTCAEGQPPEGSERSLANGQPTVERWEDNCLFLTAFAGFWPLVGLFWAWNQNRNPELDESGITPMVLVGLGSALALLVCLVSAVVLVVIRIRNRAR